MTFTQLLLNIAQSQIGITEIPKGSNKGPDIEKYLKVVGLPGGYSWCMAFVQWVLKEACKEAKRPTVPIPVSAGVLAVWNKTPVAFKVKGQPQPGDIFIMDFGKGTGHTGFVNKVDNGRIYTIEGNSNDDGSREGYEVCRKPGGRPISSIKGFIRII